MGFCQLGSGQSGFSSGRGAAPSVKLRNRNSVVCAGRRIAQSEGFM